MTAKIPDMLREHGQRLVAAKAELARLLNEVRPVWNRIKDAKEGLSAKEGSCVKSCEDHFPVIMLPL